jgi:hypothetical protein
VRIPHSVLRLPAVDRLAEQQPELLALFLDTLFELVQLAFKTAEAVREMEAGEHGDTQGIGAGGPGGDGVHQLIDAIRQFLNFLFVAGRPEGIHLVEDVDLNDLFIVHGSIR